MIVKGLLNEQPGIFLKKVKVGQIWINDFALDFVAST
jgi:hypothetical protein